MKISDFIEKTSLNSKSEPERAKLVCFYAYKETGKITFNMNDIADLLVNCGFSKPNLSRLKNSILKGKNKVFISSKLDNNLEFIPAILENLIKEYGMLWNDTVTIESSSEVIDEVKFCGKREYLSKLIKQINSSYKHNCYDACAVLMRRLFEVLLVLTFQHNHIENKIKEPSGNGYYMLERIVSIAQNDSTLKLSRNKIKYDTFRQVGNFSAHSITYTAGAKDIDDIKIDYRVMLEELYNKSGLI
jgi:hypothetical protein